MIKAILFDLDMTLIDFLKWKRFGSKAAVSAMVKAGLEMDKEKAQEELYKFYLTDIEGDKVFENFLKKHNQYSDRICAAGVNAYLKEKQNHLKTYPKVKEVLKKLKERYKIGIVTDAPRFKAFSRLDAMGIADEFDVVVGGGDVDKQKPHPLPFKKALEQLKLNPEEVLFVGDWPERDLKGAKAVGMKTCLAKYGQWADDKGIKADFEINKFEEILGVVGK